MNKPNYLIVMTDQFRKYSMGFLKEKPYCDSFIGKSDNVHTPNFDAFANQSLVLSRAISNNPLCSPFRGMFLSGRYPENNGVTMNCKAGRESELDESVRCFGDVLKDAGYSQGYIGKLHTEKPKCHFDQAHKYDPENGFLYFDGSTKDEIVCWDMITPKGKRRHGIDFWYAYNTFDKHNRPHYWDSDECFHQVYEWGPKHETDVAIEYILNENGQRDENKPFSLTLSYNPPHNPYDDVAYTNRKIYEKYYSEERVKDIDDLIFRENLDKERYKECCRIYFSHITGVDEQFGRLLDVLDREGLKENTIVLFISDHGEMMGSHGLMGKNVPYEESLSIPFLLRYPKKIKPRVDDIILSVPDIMPTLLGLGEIEDKVIDEVDGSDVSKYFVDPLNNMSQKKSEAIYIHQYDEYQEKGVYTSKYTYVVSKEKGKAVSLKFLFDNINDPYQLNSLNTNDIDKNEFIDLKRKLGKLLKEAYDPWYRDGVTSEYFDYE